MDGAECAQVTPGERLLQSSGWRPGVLLSLLYCTGQSPQRLPSSNVSSAKAGKPYLKPERDASHFVICGGEN